MSACQPTVRFPWCDSRGDTHREPPPARWTEFDLPAVAFVPGLWPRPTQSLVPPTTNWNGDHWQQVIGYVGGIDLFNTGYYWEAHEVWEGVWWAAGRTTAAARFVQGLIRLAASGVKAREGSAIGVAHHAQRAGELWRQSGFTGRYAGLQLDELQRAAAWVVQQAQTLLDERPLPVIRVLPLILWPQDD